ncbi:MAG: hypothetical protein JRI72_07150 [Deltaproteobacteria bacterium]|nr:hypothetical protein [Deltaproteobacteria bacterium]
MYLAELHGKLTQRIERMEDILTSNVFSFFKYSTRDIFLKGYLYTLGFDVSDQEANEAEFIFWPRFEENTEPDLVIIVGNYYLLIEAKYFSDFGGETDKTKAQLIREIEGGRLEAKNYGKDFVLIPITADSYYKKFKFQAITSDSKLHFKWTNWQKVSWLLTNILESDKKISKQEREFALDLYNLLDKKNLREFQSFDILSLMNQYLKPHASIFFEAKTAKFRGDFIGFLNSLLSDKKIVMMRKTIFLTTQKKIFTHLLQSRRLKHSKDTVFFKGG